MWGMRSIKKNYMLMVILVLLTLMSVQVYASECTHDWGEWYYGVETRPTCTESGTMYRKCKKCSMTEEKTVPSLGGHIWSDWREFNNSTIYDCTEERTLVRTCTRSGADYCSAFETKKYRETEHKWGEWYYYSPVDKPTCTETGFMMRKCQNCTTYDNKTVPALGHDWGEWYYLYDWNESTEPTCTESGIMYRNCKKCSWDEEKTVPALGHDWGEWYTTVSPSVISTGEDERVCFRCKKEEKRTINKIKGSYGSSSIINTYTEKKLKISNIGLSGRKKYSSSNKKVATVSKSGVIQTKRVGKCRITIKNGKQSYNINLVVRKPILDFESFIDDYNTRSNVFYVIFRNNGTNDLKITSGINIKNYDYKTFDRKISVKTVTVKPGAEKKIKFKVKGRTTWYDCSDFTLYYKIKYAGKTYKVGTDVEDSWICK